MTDQIFQNFNPVEGSSKPPAPITPERVPFIARADKLRTEDFRPQYSSLFNYSPSRGYQTATHTSIPDAIRTLGEPEPWWKELAPEFTGLGILPGQIQGAGSQVISAPNWSDAHFLDGFKPFADCQVRADSPRPDRRITYQIDGSLRRIGDYYSLWQSANSPFVQGDGAYFQIPIWFSNASHGPSARASPQQPEYTLGISTISPFQHNAGAAPMLDGLEFAVSQCIPGAGSVKRPNHSGRRSTEEWPCYHGRCDKVYQRSQELRRHIRDKHQTPRNCPFCDAKWTRSEKIRKHLITKHRDHFTGEEYREIRRLWGRNDTIRFVEKCGLPN